MRKCFSLSIRSIDENNKIVSKSRMVFCHVIFAKFTSGVDKDLALYIMPNVGLPDTASLTAE